MRFGIPGQVVEMADPDAYLAGVNVCKVFGTACTPETPIGACMVSPEGACAAYYTFGRRHRETAALLGQPRAAANG